MHAPCTLLLQAAIAAEDAAAAEEARPDDTWSEASSVVTLPRPAV